MTITLNKWTSPRTNETRLYINGIGIPSGVEIFIVETNDAFLWEVIVVDRDRIYYPERRNMDAITIDEAIRGKTWAELIAMADAPVAPVAKKAKRTKKASRAPIDEKRIASISSDLF